MRTIIPTGSHFSSLAKPEDDAELYWLGGRGNVEGTYHRFNFDCQPLEMISLCILGLLQCNSVVSFVYYIENIIHNNHVRGCTLHHSVCTPHVSTSGLRFKLSLLQSRFQLSSRATASTAVSGSRLCRHFSILRHLFTYHSWTVIVGGWGLQMGYNCKFPFVVYNGGQ